MEARSSRRGSSVVSEENRFFSPPDPPPGAISRNRPKRNFEVVRQDQPPRNNRY